MTPLKSIFCRPEAPFGYLRMVRVPFLLLAMVFLPGYLVMVEAQAQDEPARAGIHELSQAARLSELEKELKAREQEIVRREEELLALEQQIQEEMERLLALQEEAKATLEGLTEVKDKAFNDLIKVYSTMKASKVADLLNVMEDRDALEILRGLKNETVADILPRLERAKAVRLSRQLGLL